MVQSKHVWNLEKQFIFQQYTNQSKSDISYPEQKVAAVRKQEKVYYKKENTAKAKNL